MGEDKRKTRQKRNVDARPDAAFATTPSIADMPAWYRDLLGSVVGRVEGGRRQAVAAVNYQLVATYWDIGADILSRQDEQGWGARVIDRLAADVREQFTDLTGFSPRNLKYMRSFAKAWPREAIVQAPLAQLPWYHHIALLEKLDDSATRLWYAAVALDRGWSRNVMVHQIAGEFHKREGGAITNFTTTLPPGDSDLAQQSTRDPYLFDFVGAADVRRESDLQRALVQHVERFLLELGQGFAFVGQQVRLTIGDDEFYADLLFYHLKLRCYVVIELKVGKFDPSFLGQLGMYMAAVDDLLRHPDDKPTIGLLLCKTKNDIVAEYALRGYTAPIGVAEWKTAITASLPTELVSSLPTIEELEAELAADPPV